MGNKSSRAGDGDGDRNNSQEHSMELGNPDTIQVSTFCPNEKPCDSMTSSECSTSAVTMPSDDITHFKMASADPTSPMMSDADYPTSPRKSSGSSTYPRMLSDDPTYPIMPTKDTTSSLLTSHDSNCPTIPGEAAVTATTSMIRRIDSTTNILLTDASASSTMHCQEANSSTKPSNFPNNPSMSRENATSHRFPGKHAGSPRMPGKHASSPRKPSTDDVDSRLTDTAVARFLSQYWSGRAKEDRYPEFTGVDSKSSTSSRFYKPYTSDSRDGVEGSDEEEPSNIRRLLNKFLTKLRSTFSKKNEGWSPAAGDVVGSCSVEAVAMSVSSSRQITLDGASGEHTEEFSPFRSLARKLRTAVENLRKKGNEPSPSACGMDSFKCPEADEDEDKDTEKDVEEGTSEIARFRKIVENLRSTLASFRESKGPSSSASYSGRTSSHLHDRSIETYKEDKENNILVKDTDIETEAATKKEEAIEIQEIGTGKAIETEGTEESNQSATGKDVILAEVSATKYFASDDASEILDRTIHKENGPTQNNIDPLQKEHDYTHKERYVTLKESEEAEEIEIETTESERTQDIMDWLVIQETEVAEIESEDFEIEIIPEENSPEIEDPDDEIEILWKERGVEDLSVEMMWSPQTDAIKVTAADHSSDSSSRDGYEILVTTAVIEMTPSQYENGLTQEENDPTQKDTINLEDIDSKHVEDSIQIEENHIHLAKDLIRVESTHSQVENVASHAACSAAVIEAIREASQDCGANAT